MTIHLKYWCWNWSANTVAIWCKELTHWKKPWCWERLKAKWEGGGRRWDSLIALPTQFSSVHSLSCVRLFAIPRTAARQACLSITYSWSPPKPMSIESVMPSNRLILCCPLLLLPLIFPSNRIFSNELVLPSGGQSIGASATTSVLPMNIQGWFPLGLTGLISL